MHNSSQRQFVVWAVVLFFGLASIASADLVRYRVQNHPDGGEIDIDTDTDGYALRLDQKDANDVRTVQTFNANHSFVQFSWDPMSPLSTSAMMTGTLTHNESGSDPNGYDAMDDVWRIDATFERVTLTDEAGPPWYGANDPNETYDDMVADLIDDANFPDSGSDERDPSFSDEVARIYFELVDVSLTFLGPGTPTYDGATVWDEFPNDPLDKQFFLQYRWRLWKDQFTNGPNANRWETVAGAGWLEESPDTGDPDGCCQDFLFTLNPTPIPEPGTLGLLLGGIAAFGFFRSRRKR